MSDLRSSRVIRSSEPAAGKPSPPDSMSFLPSTIPFGDHSFVITAYILLLIACLSTYFILYRLLHSASHSTLPPVFPDNLHRNVHLTLLSIHNSNSSESPELLQVLKAALLLRAKEVISRIRILKRSKLPANKLFEQHYITQDVIDMLRLAEGDIYKEVAEIKYHARELGGEEWASTIMDQANECWQKDQVLRRFDKWTTRAVQTGESI